jgi:hypothetical protein
MNAGASVAQPQVGMQAPQAPVIAAGYALPDSTFGFGTCWVSWSRGADGRWLVALPGLSGTRYIDAVIDDFGNLVEAQATVLTVDTVDRHRKPRRCWAGGPKGTADRLRTK